jgi:hypothetical protein
MIMRRILLANMFLALLAVSGQAQVMAPDGENGRFTFHQVQDGLLRLDTRTGNVSLCGKRTAGWACQAVPDDRAVLESEIARLQGENATLKREMIARGVPRPGGLSAEGSGTRPQVELKLPSEAEIDRAMAFMEKVWRRLIDMVQSVQKDANKEKL